MAYLELMQEQEETCGKEKKKKKELVQTWNEEGRKSVTCSQICFSLLFFSSWSLEPPSRRFGTSIVTLLLINRHRQQCQQPHPRIDFKLPMVANTPEALATATASLLNIWNAIANRCNALWQLFYSPSKQKKTEKKRKEEGGSMKLKWAKEERRTWSEGRKCQFTDERASDEYL